MTNQERTEILNLYKAGTPLKEITGATGYKLRTINNVVKAAGIQNRNKHISKETAARARDLKAEGFSLTAIADKLKINYGTVRAILLKENEARAENAVLEIETAKAEVARLKKRVKYLTRQLEATGIIVTDPSQENTWKRPALLNETTKYDGKHRRRRNTEPQPEIPESEN